MVSIACELAVLGFAFKYLVIDRLIGQKGTLPIVHRDDRRRIILKDGSRSSNTGAEGQLFPTILPDTLISVPAYALPLRRSRARVALSVIFLLQWFLGARGPAARCRRPRRTRRSPRVLGVDVERMVLYTS